MNVLVYIDERSGEADQDSLGVLSKAAGLSASVTAVVCGGSVEALLPALGRHGAQRAIILQHPSFSEPSYGSRIDALTMICLRDKVELVLFPTTALTCDFAAGLATRLEAGLCCGLVDIELQDGRLTGKRPVENDAFVAEVEWTSPVKIGLFRPHALEPIVTGGPDPLVDVIKLDLPERASGPRLIDASAPAAGEGPALDAAEIVVSGGRGLERPENLELVRELASLLGGVPGVSLPLVEMGWAPRSMQVGQTGTVVKPRLYIACGISGQMQHRVGMENSGTIVAINRDAGAPIMSFCDLAVVADLQSVVRRLIQLLRQRRAERAAASVRGSNKVSAEPWDD